MKRVQLMVLLLAAMITSCGESNPGDSNEKIALKKIKQRIEVKGMGMVKDFTVDSISKLDSTTYFARHHFLNTMVDKEIRVSRKYYFSPGLDSISNAEDVLVEMKSEGEWVKTNL